MVSDASKKKAAQKKAATAAKMGGKSVAAPTTKAAAAENGSRSCPDNLANGVGSLQISDRNCIAVLCSHPLSRDIRWDKTNGLTYTQEQIDEVRDEWAAYMSNYM